MKKVMWSQHPEMDSFLKVRYGDGLVESLAQEMSQHFKLPITVHTLKCRASELGLDAARNQGYVPLTQAARMLYLHRKSLTARMKKRGIQPVRYGKYLLLDADQIAQLK